MKTGDKIVLVIKQDNKDNVWLMRELIVENGAVIAVTSPRTSSGRPEKLTLDPSKIELLLGPQSDPMLYMYQPDVWLAEQP